MHREREPLNMWRRLCTIGWLKRFAVCADRIQALILTAPFALGCAGCDPVVNIAGADFPAWLVCLIAGAVAAALLRPLLLKLEPYMGPPLLVYTSLAVLLACVTYLMFFNRI
jgi:hypothetical protein